MSKVSKRVWDEHFAGFKVAGRCPRCGGMIEMEMDKNMLEELICFMKSRNMNLLGKWFGTRFRSSEFREDKK